MDVETAPTFRERVKELLIERFGWRGCKHDYRVVQHRAGVSIRCFVCGHQTEMFKIAGTKD